ncbi:MAG: hypothetical protein KKH98_00965, partial [Spirochaetes bacterium]|nr:hypothetical protein [Spirochaetota bacterium]
SIMKKILSGIIVILLCVSFADAAFKEGNNYSARATGMGGAFSSIADDVSSLAYNPAGLGLMDHLEALFTYSKPFAGVDQVNLNYYFFSFAMPVEDLGVLGIGYNDFKVTSLYQEYSFIFSYGLDLKSIIPRKVMQIVWGINVKYLYHGFTLDQRSILDPVFINGRGVGNVGIDSGIIVKKFIGSLPGLNAGLFIKNINEPDLGLYNEDKVMREYRFGISYDINKNNKNKIQYTPSLDISYRDEDLNISGGMEASFFKRLLSVRAGGNFNEITFGLGTAYEIKRMMELQFDYAFQYPMGLDGSSGSHQVSLMVKF